ncbi:hypothetical protein [Lentzea sp. NBRC 102530]|uniref:hypothetical protein n=1 Tax=Lentzea sp. NBRC 102530 TaxID=3032201 RepID=UPI0024A322E9|nr:hypothetical protein [Lentzea sp. NBRC 102530]GLY48387.1 hypothetical protein Lesp01_20430 [Lentzea sp. NBRC 102530]
MPLGRIELAKLSVPDNPQIRARLAELTHPGGVALQLADTYEARDPAGIITVVVDRRQMVTDVRIRGRWFEKLRPEAFPATVYNTYVTAVQRSIAVESAHRGPDAHTQPAPPTQRPDPTDTPLEEWMASTRARLDAIDAEYDAIRRREQAPASTDVTEIRSPLGYLSMQLRGGGPISLNGDPRALDNPSDTVLAEDVLRLFVRAGLGVDPGERPRPTPRPRTGGDEGDDDYYTDFRVLGRGD